MGLTTAGIVTLINRIHWDVLLCGASFPEGRSMSTSQEVDTTTYYDEDTPISSSFEKNRLACIDSPELQVNPLTLILSQKARDHLREFVDDRKITICHTTTDPMEKPWQSCF